MIHCNEISKSYGNKVVLDNLTMELPKNQIIAFIGSNGAGKSTLMSALTRIMDIDSGQVYVEGSELKVWQDQELAKKLSILKQTNNTTARLTVKELVSFGRFPYSQGKLTIEDENKIQEALEYMEITELSDRYLDQLSGGQKQMAYIAMIIAQDTQYVFLDEPLNNLDMRHSVKIMKILKKLVRDLGKTVFVVIHDINFVSNYADYIVAMKSGKVVKADSSDRIITTEVLREIYDMEIGIQHFEGKRMCVYYN